ncbi:MAG: glycerophosphodiester phosphodiesterase family protein, partial [Phycisphaerales bacterium]
SVALASLALCCGTSARAGQTIWSFDAPANRLLASGPGVLSYRGDTGSVVTFGNSANLGLPALPGGHSGVMSVPSLSAARGILLDHQSAPNGVHVGDGWVSNYTIGFDLYIPTGGPTVNRSLFNTNLTNGNDGDFFITPAGAVGVNGVFNGQVERGRWHRVLIVVGAADSEGLSQTYIDGVFVGGHGGTGASIGSRWALYAQTGGDLILFGDDNNESAQVFVSSLMFLDRRLSAAEARALGGPTAAGLGTAGVPATAPAAYTRCAGATAHRGFSGQAPENTMASINAAVAAGASAIEMDVRVTADNVAILMHDSALDRTTNRTGAANVVTWAQLQGADAGSWYGPEFAGEPVPSLAQVFTRLRGTGVTPYLDVKVNGMAPAIAAALAQAGMTERDIWIWAYDRTLVAEFNAQFAQPRIVVGEIPRTPAAFAELRSLNVEGLDLGYGSYTGGSVDAAWVTQARAEGFFTSAYTVVGPGVMNTLIDLGVDYIETDYPAMVTSAGRAPAILSGPSAERSGLGCATVFEVSAEPGSSVRWRKAGVDLADGVQSSGAVVSGATGPRLTINGVTTADAGIYTARLENRCGGTETAALLTVCPADFDCSGGVDGDDVIAFFARWDTGDGRADVNTDQSVDGDDVITFFARWDSGC